MNIYKLKYLTREEGVRDLISKGVIIDDITYSSTTQAVVDLGDGLFDIMTSEEYDFGLKGIHPNSPDHIFSGW